MIAELLKRGEENAITTKELMRLTRAGTARELQSIIAQEREAGALILSATRNGGGYFLPDYGAKGQAEITTYIGTLRARARSTLWILRPAIRAAKSYNVNREQLSMFKERFDK